MRFLECEFLGNLVRKLPGALNLANEYICRLLNQNEADANATGKNKELCTLLSWKPAFSPIHRSAHAWMLWAPKQHKPCAPREERNSWDLCSLNFEHQMLTSLIASNRVSEARAMQTFVHEQLTLNSFQNAGASLLARPVVLTRQVSHCQLFPMLWIRTWSLCYRFHDHSPCLKRLRNARHCLQALALHRVSVYEGHLFPLDEPCQQQLTNFGPINFVCVKKILNLFFDQENNRAWAFNWSYPSRRKINEF